MGSSGGGSSSGTLGGSPIGSGDCGMANGRSATSSYIVGGKEATPHSIPWQVSVQTRSGFHFCGGTIINENYVLTAAHCVKPGDRITIVAGGHHKKNFENDGGKRFNVERIIQHPEYNRPRRLANDIALL